MQIEKGKKDIACSLWWNEVAMQALERRQQAMLEKNCTAERGKDQGQLKELVREPGLDG